MGGWVYRDTDATGMSYETRFAILYSRIKHIKNTKQLFCGNWLHKYCISFVSLNLDCFSNVTSWSRTSIVNWVIIIQFNRIYYMFSISAAKHFLVQKAMGYNFCVIRKWIKNVFHQTNDEWIQRMVSPRLDIGVRSIIKIIIYLVVPNV